MIAKEILRQIGGNSALVMIGAYGFQDHGNGVSLRIKGSRKVKYIKIMLNSKDLYDVEYGKIKVKQGEYEVVNTSNGLYNDMLVADIENATGLYLHF